MTHHESEVSIPQLLDTVEKKLDDIAETLRYSMVSSERHVMTNSVWQSDRRCNIRAGSNDTTAICNRWFTDSGLVQIDDIVSRLSTILRKTGSIKNCLAPVNRIPPETFALAATFLGTERDLINATAVCQQWRSVLLSSPRLWCNPSGSSSKLEAYLERSKSVPLEITLSSAQSVDSIIPHTSRLVALTVCMDHLFGFDQIAERLRDPIPTLLSLEIRTERYPLHILDLPSSLREGLFRHLKSLTSDIVLRGPHTFPHITELFLYTSGSSHDVLNALKQLPGLVKVSLVFHVSQHTDPWSPNIVTLPCVQEIHLCPSAVDRRAPAILPILQFLTLPKVTSITIQSSLSLDSMDSILPTASFGERLPNYVELLELRIYTTMSSKEVIFRSSSQAVFTYKTESLQEYERERRFWGNLPVSSVRRVAAVLADPRLGDEDMWLVDMLGDPDFLDLLELGGDCGRVLQRLRHRLVRGIKRICGIKTLIVRGGEYAKSQALKLESVKDDLGLKNMTVTYILDPEVYEGLAQDPDAETSTDDEGWDEDSEEDSGEDSDLYSYFEDDDEGE